ncbi:hypothetical protein [Pedobacter sp. WC2423]|uniref:hypothetical protein n=1 Tax=Pedobacter sp. WC2423 TaxID=3234142 RepID=UPI003465EF18
MRILFALITCCLLLFSCKGSHAVTDQNTTQQEKTALDSSSSTDTDFEENVKVAGIPQKAYTVAAYVAKNNKAPQGYAGGTVFKNREGLLPQGGSL